MGVYSLAAFKTSNHYVSIDKPELPCQLASDMCSVTAFVPVPQTGIYLSESTWNQENHPPKLSQNAEMCTNGCCGCCLSPLNSEVLL